VKGVNNNMSPTKIQNSISFDEAIKAIENADFCSFVWSGTGGEVSGSVSVERYESKNDNYVNCEVGDGVENFTFYPEHNQRVIVCSPSKIRLNYCDDGSRTVWVTLYNESKVFSTKPKTDNVKLLDSDIEKLASLCKKVDNLFSLKGDDYSYLVLIPLVNGWFQCHIGLTVNNPEFDRIWDGRYYEGKDISSAIIHLDEVVDRFIEYKDKRNTFISIINKYFGNTPSTADYAKALLEIEELIKNKE
jgi:hypothetical protein